MSRFRKTIRKVIPLRASVFEKSRIDLIRRIEKLDKKISSFDDKEKYLYKSTHEKNSIKSFRAFRERSDFQQCLIDLLKNLDEKSRATVTQVLRRQEIVMGAEKLPLNIFTLEEQKKIS